MFDLVKVMRGIISKMWKWIKWLVWKTASIGGECWGNRIWMIYSLAKVFIWARILRTYVNEPEGKLIRKIIKKGQVCFDIGASIGTYTYLLSSLVESNGLVYSFEPLPRTFYVLQKMVKVFHLNNVVCHEICLGDHVGFTEFVGGAGRPGNTYAAHIRGAGETEVSDFQMVPMTTLDTLVTEQGIKRVDFIKCDVEGAELLVFKGGKNMLTQYCPIVMCEITRRGMKNYNFSTAEIFTFFRELGYQSFAWQEGNLLPVNDKIPEAFNYIFLPQERVKEVLCDLNRKNQAN